MRSSRTTSKGKGIDRSTEWTDYTWHDDGYWYATRTGPTGDLEYDYQYPQSATPQQQFETPRTPRTDDFATVKSGESFKSEDEDFSKTSTDHRQQPLDSISDGSPHYQHGGEDLMTSNESYHSPNPRAQVERTESTISTSNFIHSNHQKTENVLASSDAASYSTLNASKRGDTSNLAHTFDNLTLENGLGAYSAPANAPLHLPQVPKHIYREADSEDFEELDHRYRVVEIHAQKRFWKEGRVFMMLWTEPARPPLVDREGGTRNGSHFSTTIWGESAYSEIRRFVVVSAGYGNNICVPIQTYCKQATLKQNLPDPQAHAIIYTGTKVPDEKWYYALDGSVVAENLTKDPIRVISEQKDREGELHPASRINYSKIYTVENFVRVLNIGMVHKNSMPSLLSNSMVNRSEPPQAPRKNPPRASGSSESRDQSSKNKGSSHRDKGKDSGRKRK